VLALVLWTVLVWLGRVRNAAAGDEGIAPVLLAATFVVLAGAVLATRGREPRLVVALAGWTTAVWLVRIVDIALASGHGAGFVAVHAVLAAVSIALSVWARRAVRALAGRRVTASAQPAARRGRG
jgi:hypothetical protein